MRAVRNYEGYLEVVLGADILMRAEQYMPVMLVGAGVKRGGIVSLVLGNGGRCGSWGCRPEEKVLAEVEMVFGRHMVYSYRFEATGCCGAGMARGMVNNWACRRDSRERRSQEGRYSYALSKDLEHLTKLSRELGLGERNHGEIGRLLDIPQSAREWYVRTQNPWAEMSREARAIVGGRGRCGAGELPEWVAFCPFVVPPDEFYVNGECARTGRRYREITYMFNEEIGQGVEENFRRSIVADYNEK